MTSAAWSPKGRAPAQFSEVLVCHRAVTSFVSRRRRHVTGSLRQHVAATRSVQAESWQREQVILAHIGHVERDAQYIASRFGARFDKSDLAAEGMLKLTAIAEEFDPTRGASFWTFAKQSVRGAMWELVRRRNYREASHLELIAEQVQVADSRQGPEEAFAAVEQQELARDAMTALDARERVIVGRYYAGEENFGVIGLDLGISASMASRIHCQALDKMQLYLRRKGIARRGPGVERRSVRSEAA